MKHYNLKVKVMKIEGLTKIKRIEGAPVDMAVCLVGDDTGCGKLLLKDAQVAFAKVGDSLILRNAMARIVKERIRLQVDIWGKIEHCTVLSLFIYFEQEALGEATTKNNISEAEYEAVPAKQ